MHDHCAGVDEEEQEQHAAHEGAVARRAEQPAHADVAVTQKVALGRDGDDELGGELLQPRLPA